MTPLHNKKYLILIFAILFWGSDVYSQGVTAADCQDAVNVCTNLGFQITTNGTGNVNDIPSASANTPCNPNVPPTGTGTGCLLSGEVNSTWMVVNIAGGGSLEFVFGANNTQQGFYDWSMWPYNPNSTCNDLFNCTLPPVACNWNASSVGGTGMGPVPAGGSAGNFVPSINVQGGEQYIICFTNWSGSQNVNVPLVFGGTSTVSCFPVNQTICEGDSATLAAGGPAGSTYLWTPGTGLSSTTDSTVMASPLTTTDYTVSITDPFGNLMDTIVTVTVHAPPTPDAGPDDISCSLSYTLAGVESDTFGSTWTYISPGPGATIGFVDSNDPNTTVYATQPGTYQFILTEDNGWCPPVSDTVNIVFADVPHSTILTNPLCDGSADGRVDVVAPTAAQYSMNNMTWQADSFFTGLSSGVYWVYVLDVQGCVDSSIFTLTDPVPVSVVASPDSIVCIDGTATISAVASGGAGGYTMTWDNSLMGNGPHNVNPVALTCYSVFATDANGCTSPIDDVCIDLHPSIVPTTSGDTAICSADLINISANATGGIGAPYTYAWDENGNSVGSGATISVNPTATTTYCVTVTDGCETPSEVSCLTVSINPMPVPNFTVDIDSACIDVNSTFTLLADPLLVQTAEWDFGNGQTAINPGMNPQATYTLPGCYDVSLTLTTPDGCVIDTMMPEMVCAYGFPIADFIPNPQPTTTSNTTITFYNYSTDNLYNEWNFDSLGTSTELEPQFTFPNTGAGLYPVTLTVTNEFGCVDVITIDVTIQEDFLIYVPNSFTPDGNGVNDFFFVLGNDIDASFFTMRIFNRWGELVFEGTDPSQVWDGTYKGQPVQDGTYIWTVQTRGGFDQVKREFTGHVTVLR